MAVRIAQAKNNLGRERFVAVAHYGRYPGYRGQLTGRALRIAACDNDLCGRTSPMSSANVGARCAVGFGGHAAGIHDNHIASELILLAECMESLADRIAVGTRRSATEVFYMNAGHIFSLEPEFGDTEMRLTVSN
jgi:hypothetical protein